MTKPNILFVILRTELGGVQVVTSVLANKLVNKGYEVCIFSFLDGKNSISKMLDNRVKLYQQNNYSQSQENISVLRKILIENDIKIIVNQNGMPIIPIKTICKAAKGLDVKIISVFHNVPGANGRIQSVDIDLSRCHNGVKRIELQVKRWIVAKITGYGMAYNYKRSDMFLVLSPSYIDKFKSFTGLRNPAHLQVLANPITIDPNDYVYDIHKKQKEIIYVGRLDSIQKRVCRIIDTWSYLERDFYDWRLTIVGDGEDKNRLQEQARRLGLKQILFEGYQNPKEYYKRASILVLTSDFEGFPLVLGECMSFGVVPIVYNSFSAVRDIIEDGKNGILIPFCQEGYQAEVGASLLSNVMKDAIVREQLALNAIEKSKEFSLSTIFEKWQTLLDTLS